MASFTLEEIVRATGGEILHRGQVGFVSGVSTDTRSIQSGEVFIALIGENFNGHGFLQTACAKKAAAVIISEADKAEGLDETVSIIWVKDTHQALEDLAHFHRMRFQVPVIGVTGSNGKTTTKDMITALLSTRFHVCATQKNFNNEIGLSMTLLSMTEQTEVCVVEMGMRGFGQIAELCRIASPTIGVVTNVGTSHIGILGSQANIAKAKGELIEALPDTGIAVLNGDDSYVSAMGNFFSGKTMTYGLENHATVMGQDIHYEADQTRFTCKLFDEAFKVKLGVLGPHNVYDALAAITVARILGVDSRKMQKALAEFKPIGQRQTILDIHGISIMDDSYNANPLSMEMAFRSLKQLPGKHHYLVLGDMGELGAFENELHYETGKKAAALGFDGLITVGPLSHQVAQGAKEGGLPLVEVTESCEEAAKVLSTLAQPGDIVLIKGSHYMHMESIPMLLRGVLEKDGN